MNWYFLLYTLPPSLLLLLLLYLSNESRPHRYRQRFLPITVIFIALAACIIYLPYGLQARQLFDTAVDWAAETMQLDLSSLHHYFLLFFNLLLVLVLLACKSSLRLLTALFRQIMRLIRWLKTKLGVKTEVVRPARRSLFPAYTYYPGRGVTILDNWIYPGRYLRTMAWIYGILLLGCLGCFAYDPSIMTRLGKPGYLDLFILPLLFFLETGWYLGGDRPLDKEGDLSGEDARFGEKGSFAELWEQYGRICANRLLAGDDRL